MLKAKLVYSELPVNLSTLAALMKNNQYSENTSNGFFISTATPKKLVGKFIEKSIVTNTLEDPFGTVSKIESTTYYVCNFSWHADSSILIIDNPPRSLRKFANKMHELTGLGLVLSEINLDLIKFIELIQLKTEQLTITELSSFGIRISDRASAKIKVSGTKDVRDDFDKVVCGKKFVLDSIVFEGHIENASFIGELTRTGNFRTKSNNTYATLDLIREHLDIIQLKPS